MNMMTWIFRDTIVPCDAWHCCYAGTPHGYNSLERALLDNLMSNVQDKVFGLENFGNTCYCNSVLQCLFYAKDFRESIISLNEVSRPLRLDTPGKASHQFLEQPQPLNAGSAPSGIRSKLKKEKFEAPETPVFLDGLDVGPWRPGQGIPIVGYTDDPAATPEIKKRAALTKGPIINLDHSLAEEYHMKDSLLTALKDLFECIEENESKTGVASPSFFMELLKKNNDLFRSSMHQDAHEFYSFLLNSILEIVDNEAIRDMFEGCLTNELRCVTCETTSYRDEKFLDLSLDLENNTSVTECLRQFSKSEVLGGQNKFYCDNCSGLQEAHKRLKVKRAPAFLTLHLKRFKYSENDNENIKLQHRVTYTKYLKIPFMSDGQESSLYELKGVVVHLGGGPYQGHYISVNKTEYGWLLFDDETVEAVDETYVFKFFGDNTRLTCAYVLFYQRIDRETYERDNLYVNAEVSHLETESVVSASDLSSTVFSEDSRRDSEVGTDSRRRRSTVNSSKLSKDSKLFGLFRRGSVAASPP